ncbi:tRNA pseudouridine(38-40) synthase TruA [Janthinobacterium sp. 17J80-10]|uniref:tRNA pseudouridine(38-40) synthase TruA n=1 Tax=Janthinobacterium sp. 17J80-10 TaxID=2497863 RepID=UPI0010056FB3|nr:tRNA pseudouridine(38-40) synthase TruA [Janthinobacterium sp. 17J80-10]QAU34734.1 tRNA pseudouridine(38-40) synthase TruA [Janthinobacterium sp. 17J80-10]
MKRIVLGLQYDGAPWHGWQTQPDGHTVQDQLEAALLKFSRTGIDITCAGRTDTGVHALEQVVHFDTGVERDVFSWVRGVNAFLPSSIAVQWAREVAPDAQGDEFHARFSAGSRTYHYLLHNHPTRSPLLAGKAGWVFRPLDAALMQQAAAHLHGTHDFSAFRAAECQAKSPVRTMQRIDIARRGDLITFSLTANAFLHHMVRNIVGSLIAVGIGKYPPDWMAEALDWRDRSRVAPTFMPDGLYLAQIAYDSKWGLPQEAAQPFWL